MWGDPTRPLSSKPLCRRMIKGVMDLALQTISFLEYERLANVGDYEEFLFRFSLVDTTLIGTPEESALTTPVPVFVKISRTLQNTWRLQLPDLVKILFEYAKRHLMEQVSKGAPVDDARVDLNSSTAPAKCPYDSARVAMDPGSSFEVDVKRNLGFRTE